MLAVVTASCAQSPQTDINKIFEYCGKEKSDPAVVAKMKHLGININGDGYKYYQPKSRTDYKLVRITLNPQPTYNDIQGISISWNKDPGLSYEEIQQLVEINMPKRGSKELQIDDGLSFASRYIMVGYKPNATQALINQVTVTCAKNNLDKCWQIDFSCFDFVHPESD